MEFVNSKGVKYYLHYIDIIFGRGRLPKRNYFFAMNHNGDLCGLPIGFKVSETKTGMPVLKRL